MHGFHRFWEMHNFFVHSISKIQISLIQQYIFLIELLKVQAFPEWRGKWVRTIPGQEKMKEISSVKISLRINEESGYISFHLLIPFIHLVIIFVVWMNCMLQMKVIIHSSYTDV